MTGLARHLAALPDSPAERAPGRPWSALAEQLAAQPPGLADPRLGNALTLQITALTSLLAAAAGQAPTGASGERELVGHERGYLRRAAAKRRLFNPGVLSDRTDDDERAAQAWAALERALAGIILLGPCGTSQAQAIGALASDDRAGDVVNWLAALYPPPGEELGLGTVQPDRLAELLLGPVLTRQAELLGEIGALAEAADDGYAALFTLMRTAAHPGFSQVGEQAADLIASRPVPFAVAAPVLAATLPQPAPLRDGLLHLGQQDPQQFRQTAYMAINQLPEISISGALFGAALTTTITGILRQLADANPDAYLPDLAISLNNLGVRLADTGQRQAALAPAREAVTIRRQLAEANPDAYLPDLAMSLNNLGNHLAETGQRQAALAPAREAADTYRQLAEANPGAYLPGLAMALTNLGAQLADAGQRQAALAPAQEAADTYRQLAAANPDAYLPNLAASLNNLGVQLAETGQRQAALAPAREAVTIRRQLADTNPDAYLPSLAMALTNLSVRLAETGQRQAALDPAQEAADTYRQLAEASPDAYLPDLAMSLNNLGNRLAETGQRQAALDPAQEAADTYRQLAEASPDAYLPDLAMAVNNLGVRLAETGQREAALAPAQEAADAYRQLADANPGAYLPDLATALNNLGNRLAETGQRQAALAPAQEAADAYRQLADTNPDAYLPDLAQSLTNLSARLAETDRDAEVGNVWESAIVALPEESARLALTVAYAGYLLGRPDPGAGVELLVKVLRTPGVSGPVEADARRLLRGHWRQHPDAVEAAWQSPSTVPVPDWMSLTDDHINTVIDWISTATWAESRGYFHEHSGTLLAATTATVLGELSLTASEDLISQHRDLVEAVREHGLDAAYRPLLADETLREWIAAPSWEASRAFLHDHPELLDEEIPGLLANLTQDPDPAITVHHALLTLARTPSGADGAYQSLEDAQALQDMASAALAARDTGRLRACADIETFIHGRALAGALHMILAWLLAGPAGPLPESWASQLRALAAQADPAEKDTALAQFNTALASIPADSAMASQLRRILSLPDEP